MMFPPSFSSQYSTQCECEGQNQHSLFCALANMRLQLSELVKSNGHLRPVCRFIASAVSWQQTYMQLLGSTLPTSAAQQGNSRLQQNERNVGGLSLDLTNSNY